jgi:hypothetical protein
MPSFVDRVFTVAAQLFLKNPAVQLTMLHTSLGYKQVAMH